MAEEKLKAIWRCMKYRCHQNKNDRYFKNGIKVHPNWYNNYTRFKNYVSCLPKFDMNNIGLYSENISLDRINNKGNYEPGNLRWATKKEQFENSSTFKAQLWFPHSPRYFQRELKKHLPLNKVKKLLQHKSL